MQLKKVINPPSWFHVNPKCGKYGLLATTEIHTHTRTNSQLHVFNTNFFYSFTCTTVLSKLWA